MQVSIHFDRPGKHPREFREGFLEDDGLRLRTRSLAPPNFSNIWWRQGLLPRGSLIFSVSKYHFYREPFGIMEFRDGSDALLGFYCDIATPLERRADGYHLTDLFLDLWVFPNRTCQVLDEEEFEEAVQAGLIGPEQARLARECLPRLLRETASGRFPYEYMR